MASTGELLYQGLSGFGNKLADAMREHKANRDERDAIEQKAESLAPILKQRMTMEELADEEGPASTLLAGFANSPNMSNAKLKVLLSDAMLYIDKKEKQQQQAEARQIQLLTQQRLAEQSFLQNVAASRQEAVFNRQQAQDANRPKFHAAVSEAAQSPYDRRVAGLSQYAGNPWDLAATRLPQSGESVEQTPVAAAQLAGIGARLGYDPTAQDFRNLVREPRPVSATEDLRAQAAFLTAQTMAKRAEAEASGDSEVKPPRAVSIRDTLTIDDKIAKLTKEYNETDERGTKAVLLDRINALRRVQAAGGSPAAQPKQKPQQASPQDKAQLANQLAADNPSWTRQRIIDEVNRSFNK